MGVERQKDRKTDKVSYRGALLLKMFMMFLCINFYKLIPFTIYLLGYNTEYIAYLCLTNIDLHREGVKRNNNGYLSRQCARNPPPSLPSLLPTI